VHCLNSQTRMTSPLVSSLWHGFLPGSRDCEIFARGRWEGEGPRAVLLEPSERASCDHSDGVHFSIHTRARAANNRSYYYLGDLATLFAIALRETRLFDHLAFSSIFDAAPLAKSPADTLRNWPCNYFGIEETLLAGCDWPFAARAPHTQNEISTCTESFRQIV
jgi:hypothetical protein